MTPELDRIAFGTRHYSALRAGVIRAVCIPCLLAGVVLEYVNNTRGIVHAVTGLLNIFGCAALAILLWQRTNRWMDRWFGRVRAGGELRRAWMPILASWTLSIGNRVDERYAVASGLPSATFTASALYAAWLVVRLWPHGWHNVVPAAVSLWFAFRFTGVADAAAVDPWQWNAFRATSLSWVAAGLADLLLLCRFLPYAAAEEGSTGEAPGRSEVDEIS